MSMVSHNGQPDPAPGQLPGGQQRDPYSCADALARLTTPGFFANGPSCPPAAARVEDPELNDWLFAREIPELAAWFEEDRWGTRAP